MKKLLVFFFFLVLGFFVVTTLFSAIDLKEVWNTLRKFSLLEAFAVFLLTAVFIYVGAVKWHKILRRQGHNIPVFQLWKIYLASFAISFFAPMVVFGAEVFRGYTLRERHDVPFAKGMATVMIDRILETTSYLVIITAGILVFFLWGNPFSLQTALIIFAALVVVGLLLAFFYLRMFKSESIVRIFIRRPTGNHIVDVEDEISRFFHWNDPAVWTALSLSFLKSGVGLVRVWVLMVFLAKTIVFLPAITVLGFYYLALLIPIPAALGSHDALQALAFQSFGLGGAPVGVAFAFVIRAVEAIFALVGTVLLVHFGLGLLSNFVAEKISKRLR